MHFWLLLDVCRMYCCCSVCLLYVSAKHTVVAVRHRESIQVLHAGGKMAYGAIDAIGGAMSPKVVKSLRKSGKYILYGALDTSPVSASNADLLAQTKVLHTITCCRDHACYATLVSVLWIVGFTMLCCAALCCVVLCCAVLRCAVLCYAMLCRMTGVMKFVPRFIQLRMCNRLCSLCFWDSEISWNLSFCSADPALQHSACCESFV